jgi:hypothetical protein
MTTLKTAKQPAPKTSKLDEKLVASEVLSTIETESHRPSAIVTILSGKYDQNTILKTLLTLEKEGRVERDSKKAWIAKGGEKQQQKKEKEKAKSKEKQKEKEKDKDKDKE